MTTYIALLRGINVGGNNIIKMQDLRDMFEVLQFEHVRTYIQSGNVVFDSPETPEKQLAAVIGEQIRETFGFGISVIIRSLEELEAAVAGNPFQLTGEDQFKRLYISFLADEPSPESLEKLRPYEEGADKLRVIGKEMYTLYEVSASQSPLFKVSLDKLLGTPVTARNWNTVNKLIALGRTD